MGRLTEQLGTSVYLDTNIIIYAVEGYETHAAPIRSLLQGLTEGEIIAVTSELTVAEASALGKSDPLVLTRSAPPKPQSDLP